MRSDVHLKIRLGELVLANPVVSALVLECNPFAPIPPDWPLEELGDLPHDVEAAVLPSWPTAGGPVPVVQGLTSYVPSRYRRYYVDLGIGWNAYDASFSGKSRSSLKRKVRRYREAAGGVLDVREYATPEAMPEFHALARSLSELTYQHRLMGAGLPGGDAFRRDMVARAAEGRARGYVLMMRDRPAAYMYCPVDQGVVAYDRVGYDPELGHLSPGTVLFRHAIERLFATPGLTKFDFTEGGGGHKAFFSTGSVDCADIYFLRGRARILALVAAHSAAATVSKAAAGALDAMHLKHVAKRMLRRLERRPPPPRNHRTAS